MPIEVVAGQGAAPALATREFFAARGGIPAKGLEPAAVPAVLDACLTALDRRGTRTFAEAAAPMLRLLDRHEKAWHRDLARTIRRLIEAERDSAADRRRGLRLVSDYFYRGPLAREIGNWSAANGGLLRYGDLARHVTRVEEPVQATYRGHHVYKCGPWTQGPFLLEALQLLEGFDLKAMGRNSPDAIHVTVEAMKLAMADRDTYYADPLFEDVPLDGLLAPAYAEARRQADRHEACVARPPPGRPANGKALLADGVAGPGQGSRGHDTTTCLVADKDGNVVAATPSGWSGVVAGDTGVWLGTRLQSFNLWPGHPNCIAPGKRPQDHADADDRDEGQEAGPGRERRGWRQPGHDDAPAAADPHRLRPGAGRIGDGPAVHERPLHRVVPPGPAGSGRPADQSLDRPGRRSMPWPAGATS